MSTDPVQFLLKAAMRLPRPAIERLTEGLIAGLDLLDGDPDDEPEQDVDAAHDDGCGPVHLHGRRCWGSEHDEAGTLRPISGVDQTRDPIGEKPVALPLRHVRKRQEHSYE